MKQTVIERVKLLIDRKFNGNVKSFAEHIGLAQTTVNNYILESRKPSLEFICAIIESSNELSAEWLLRGQGQMELSVMDRLALKIDGGCGCGNDSIFDNEIHNSTVSNGDAGYKELSESLQKRCESLEEQNKSLIEIIKNLSVKS